MNKYIMECQTSDYGLTEDTKKYAMLFSTQTSINNSNHYNDCQVIFRVFHISSSSGIVLPKDYMLTTVKDGSNIINFIDLNPEITGVDVGYTLDGDTLYMRVKGSIIGAKVKLQVLYCSTIGMFNFYNNSEFTIDTTIIKPTNRRIQQSLVLQNGWVDNQYTPCILRKNKDIVTLNINISKGTISSQTVISSGLPKPANTIQFAICDTSGNAGCLEITTAGNLRVVYIKDNTKDQLGTVSYFCYE